MTSAMIRTLVGLLLILGYGSGLHAQALFAAKGPGGYVAAGATLSTYESDYGQRRLGGGTLFVDANLYRRIGVEAEARYLRVHSDENISESNFLIGPKISTHTRNLRPYAKLLIGRGHLNFPFNYAQGSYFVVAPGAGLDWRIGEGRLTIRVIDIEYQDWPLFTFGTLHPYGVSSGLSLRIF
jgi:hypothetical protein